jgi:hypothetical protein
VEGWQPADGTIHRKRLDTTPVEGNDRLYYVTSKGKTAFTQMGIDLSLIPAELLENK